MQDEPHKIEVDIGAAVAALEASPELAAQIGALVGAPTWRDMATAPQDESTFLAAVLVHNSLTQRDHWEYALMHFSEGQFLFNDEADTGWGADDYTHWMPISQPV